jgi:hypothetical protein
VNHVLCRFHAEYFDTVCWESIRKSATAREGNMDQPDKDFISDIDQLEKDLQEFKDNLANGGVVRKVIIDGISYYFEENDPEYKKYLALQEEGNSESHSRYA